jgi:hypothetical protein
MHNTLSPIAQITLSGDSSFSVPVPDGCSQIFSNCTGIDCERDCGARRTIPAYNLVEQKISADRWELAIVAFAVFAMIAVFLAPVAVDRFDAVQIATSEDVQ